MSPLLEIVKPKIIITLGLSSYRGVLSIFEKAVPKNKTLKSQIEISPFDLPNKLLLFPMYHCGASVINRSRNLGDQKKDWAKLNSYLKYHNIKSPTP
jgi:uracil-DNA glycosylase